VRSLLLVAALAGMTAGGPGCASTQPGADGSPPVAGAPAPRSVVPGEYVVTFAVPATAELARQVFGRFGPTKVQEMGNGMFLVALGKDPGLAALQELQRQDDRIRAVQPNFVYTISR
jgi:hypothetical protein